MGEEKQQPGPSATDPAPAEDGGAATSKHEELVDNQNFEGQFPFSRLIIILSALAFTLFVSFLDQTSISTALPAIAKDLNAFESISWVGMLCMCNKRRGTLLRNGQGLPSSLQTPLSSSSTAG